MVDYCRIFTIESPFISFVKYSSYVNTSYQYQLIKKNEICRIKDISYLINLHDVWHCGNGTFVVVSSFKPMTKQNKNQIFYAVR